MKKIIAVMMIVGLMFMVGGTITFAEEPGRGRYFVDADGDGICDNYASGQCHGRGHGCGYGGRGNGFRGGRCR